MYIFELANEIFRKIKKKEKKFIPQDNNETFDFEDENCSHIFAPVDSTKKILACTKCGIIKKVK